jgi:demethylmenaquinone methyltransferase / 2-methoxy-6-polyprenyl-1,4-benzoquinol methylase
VPVSQAVESMFTGIATRYDRANDVLSLGIHRRWRRVAVKASKAGPGDAVLDVATGTGDLAFAFRRAVGASGTVVGLDFSSGMLAVAQAKRKRNGLAVDFVRGDALALPFTARFDVASIAFGIRNVDDPKAGIAEMARRVRPGGRLVVLEFGTPKGVIGPAYRWYGRHVMPRVGGLVTGDRAAFEYLPRTAAAFPYGDAFAGLMRKAAAFEAIEVRPLTGGVAWLYVGTVA